MTLDQQALVQKLWDYCDVLRDDGLSYGDYIEQLTYLLFLKMADEQHRLLGDDPVVPAGLDWSSLLRRSGNALEVHYSEILNALGSRGECWELFFARLATGYKAPPS